MRAKHSHNDFWHLLSDSERSELTALGHIGMFLHDDVMAIEGDLATHLFVLLVGWVKIRSVTGDGRELLLALRGDGDIVGELAGESTGYRTATVQAIGTVRSLIVAHGRFTAFLDSRPDAARAYRRVVTHRWAESAELLRDRSITNGAQRLAGLLLDLADHHGTQAESGTIIEVPLSQDEMASLIGASRATVTRALGDWRQRGFISTGHRQFTIIDDAQLRRISGR
jgi:CRP/FNR family transcriptional regulator, cyclic AMP receptor protein